jgi:hypothetical protein
MSLRFPHRSTDGHTGDPAAAQGPAGQLPDAPELTDSPASYPTHACCCPARPMVKVVMPATATRASADLWLCGHHWRASREALAGSGAVVYDLSPAEAEPAAVPQGVVV